jgi:molecular chaperone DnaK
MTYWLGIDLGTTYTAAAICRLGADQPETQVFPLSGGSHAMPSVLFLPGEGSVVVGEGADRRAVTDPDRVVREFKRRIGDDIPVLVGGRRYHAHYLAATVVHWVWQRVAEREGEPPERVALTVPAGWGPYKTGLFARAVQDTGIGDATVLTEPQAAAISYASRERVEPGALLTVYDLGGGTFDAAVLRKDSSASFRVLGRPDGIEGLGGVTFDEAIFEHVCAAADVPLAEMDPTDPDVVSEVTRLRRECTQAKEALSADTEATIPVALGGVRQRIRVTRAEFEEMIRPDLYRTIEALRRALASADIGGDRPDAILLVGGSSRIPMVSQLISAEFGQAPAIDTDPKTAVAAGAARFLAPPARRTRGTAAAPVRHAARTATESPASPPERPRMPTMLASAERAATRSALWRLSRKTTLGMAALLLLLVVGAVTALRIPGSASLAHSGAVSNSPDRVHLSTAAKKPSRKRPVSLVGMNASPPASPTPHPRPSKTRKTPQPTPSPATPTPTPTLTLTPTPTATPTPTPTPTPTSTTTTPAGTTTIPARTSTTPTATTGKPARAQSRHPRPS